MTAKQIFLLIILPVLFYVYSINKCERDAYIRKMKNRS
jgi:hypothetical protein